MRRIVLAVLTGGHARPVESVSYGDPADCLSRKIDTVWSLKATEPVVKPLRNSNQLRKDLRQILG